MAFIKTLHPDGYYKVRVIGNTYTVSKNTGMPYIVLKVEVLEKSGKGPKGEFTPGAHKYVNLFTSELSFPTTESILQAAGVDTTDEDQIERLAGDHPSHLSLEGFEFFARNRQQEYKGEMSDNFSPSKNWEIRSPNDWMRNMVKPGRAEKAQLAALFGATKKLNRGAARPPAPRPTATAVDSEVPW